MVELDNRTLFVAMVFTLIIAGYIFVTNYVWDEPELFCDDVCIENNKVPLEKLNDFPHDYGETPTGGAINISFENPKPTPEESSCKGNYGYNKLVVDMGIVPLGWMCIDECPKTVSIFIDPKSNENCTKTYFTWENVDGSGWTQTIIDTCDEIDPTPTLGFTSEPESNLCNEKFSTVICDKNNNTLLSLDPYGAPPRLSEVVEESNIIIYPNKNESDILFYGYNDSEMQRNTSYMICVWTDSGENACMQFLNESLYYEWLIDKVIEDLNRSGKND